MIWFRPTSLEEIRPHATASLVDHLGIEFTELGPNYLRGSMPVDQRTTQPMAGILHGGASVALAETLGSLAANLVVDPEKRYCVGLDIHANHLRSVKKGNVHGIARPIHLGSSTQVWGIEITDADGQLICIARLTMAVLDKNRGINPIYKIRNQSPEGES